jgi:hypothetical protein
MSRATSLVLPRPSEAAVAPAHVAPGKALSASAAFFLYASLAVSFLAGSSAPTPLYAVYQAAWGFSPITITVVFGIYAVAVLAALLVVGAVSDYVGRRPVLITAALAQAAAMVLFAVAGGVGTLVAARIVQGLATGAAAGAIGAGLLDVDRRRGTVANAVGPLAGTGLGALLSGVMVAYLPAPTTLVYALLAAVFLAQAVAVAGMPETAARRPGALSSLRPQLRMPVRLRAPMAVAAPALVAAWAIPGFYGSLGPSLVGQLFATRSGALGGVTFFVLAASGAIAVLLTRDRPAVRTMMLGIAAIIVGVSATVLAIGTSSAAIFFAGCTLAGLGFGAAFQGAIRSVVGLAEAHERAGVLSLLYVVAYLAMGAPAVLAGVRTVHGGGLVQTAREYGVAVVGLGVAALVARLLQGSGKR